MIEQLLLETVASIAEKYSENIVTGTSLLEKSGPALLLAAAVPTPHTIAKKMKREIAHVHSSAEYSIHLALTPADCKQVIEKAWGERMTLAGSLMPQEYLLIYTPRTREELEAVGNIVEAAVGFMSGGRHFVAEP